MTITVNQPEKINVAEGQKVEFKTSAFYAPGEQNPGFKQMRTIAETVAAFMNAEGGTLYIGVADDGTIRGIGKDLDVLGFVPSSVALKMPKMNDADFAYKATTDHYQLKLQHIFQAFLSPNHTKYVESISFGHLTKEFKKHLVTIQKPREKHPECYPTKFGSDGKVRIKKSLGNKAGSSVVCGKGS